MNVVVGHYQYHPYAGGDKPVGIPHGPCVSQAKYDSLLALLRRCGEAMEMAVESLQAGKVTNPAPMLTTLAAVRKKLEEEK